MRQTPPCVHWALLVCVSKPTNTHQEVSGYSVVDGVLHLQTVCELYGVCSALSSTNCATGMAERRQPYGYRPIGHAPRVLNDSLPERERERAHHHRQHQKSMKSYKVRCCIVLFSLHSLLLCMPVYPPFCLRCLYTTTGPYS